MAAVYKWTGACSGMMEEKYFDTNLNLSLLLPLCLLRVEFDGGKM